MNAAAVRALASLGVALWLGAPHAHAQDVPHRSAALTWRAPPGCPSAADLRVAIAHALDWSPFVPGSTPQLVLEGDAHLAGERWAIAITLRTPDGERLGRRELVSESARCDEALDSVALVAAMMIESPQLEARLHHPAPPRPFGGLVLAARLGLAVDFLSGPTVAPGVRAEIAVTPPGAWALVLSASFLPESVARDAVASARFRFLSFALSTCPDLLNVREGSLSVCGGIDLLLIEATETGGLAEARSYLDPTLRPFVGVRGEVVVTGPLRAGISLDIAVPLNRYHYDYTLGSATVGLHDLPFVTLISAAWLGLQLP